MGEVGTTKVFENECIAVWEFVLQPGERTPRHTHRHDYVFYVLEGTTLEVFDAEDRFLFAFDSSAGACFGFHCEGGELVSNDGKGLRAPATHSARNAGSNPYREILIEMKS